MNLNRVFVWTIVLATMVSCDPNILLPTDPDVQRAEDIVSINETIDLLGLGTPDTTESGARYFIFREGDQNEESVQQLDFVTFDYIGYFLDGRVFDTSLPAVADTAFSFTGDIVFRPQTFTYTETGWSLRYVPVVSQYINGPNNATALMEAISIGFSQMVPGDRILIFLPSDQAVTSATRSAAPVYFEIFLRFRRPG